MLKKGKVLTDAQTKTPVVTYTQSFRLEFVLGVFNVAQTMFFIKLLFSTGVLQFFVGIF